MGRHTVLIGQFPAVTLNYCTPRVWGQPFQPLNEIRQAGSLHLVGVLLVWAILDENRPCPERFLPAVHQLFVSI
jgi:hypothetical protein